MLNNIMAKKILSVSFFFFFTALIAADASADTLVLKNGKKYVGKITRSAPGKITIKTKKWPLTFPDDKISFRLTKMTPPKDAEKAFALLKQKKFAQALPAFQNWLKRFNDLPVMWFERALYGAGICLANTGKTKEALPLLKKLLAVFPNTRYKNEAEFWLIESQLSGEPGPELEKKLKDLIANPKTGDRIRAKAHQGLAKYYDSRNQTKKALEEYVSIIVLHGDIDELQQSAQQKCADLFLQLGRTNEAAFYYKQIIEAYPNTDGAKNAEKKLLSINNVKGDLKK